VNNMHSLHFTRAQSEALATVGIDMKKEGLPSEITDVVFGLGMHSVGDFLPHFNPGPAPSAGHRVGTTESGKWSHYLFTDPDHTLENPRMARATFERFRYMWSRYLGKGGATRPLTGTETAQLAAFIYGKDMDEKASVLNTTGINGMAAVSKLLLSK